MLGIQGTEETGPGAETVRTSNVPSPTVEAPPQTISAWGKSVQSDGVGAILQGFNIQKLLRDQDKKKNAKTCSEAASLKNYVQLGTGSILAFMQPGGTNLGWIAGMGTYPGGLTSTSAYNNCDIGLASDRTKYSEPVAAMVEPEFWEYHKVVGVSNSGTGLAAFYRKDENRTKFYNGEDDKENYTWMPAFLIIPQELVAWFLENEPTGFELYEKVHSISRDGDLPEELKLAVKWCLCACHGGKNLLRQKVTTVLFSPRETPCASWVAQRVTALLGEGPKAGSAQQGVTPPTPRQSAPAPVATPSPTKPRTYFDPSETFKATLTILSHKGDASQVSTTWGELLQGADENECATILERACMDMRKILQLSDGGMPNIDYVQIIKDLKDMNLAPGGRQFSFAKFSDGMSILITREETADEITQRDRRNKAESQTRADGNMSLNENLNRLKRDPPLPANTYMKLLKCITAYGVLVAGLFTKACPHFRAVWTIRELIAKMDREEGRYFSAHTCRLIVFHIIVNANKYFSNVYRPEDLAQAVIPFPQASLRALGENIEMLAPIPQTINFPPQWVPAGGGTVPENDRAKGGGGFGGGGNEGKAPPTRGGFGDGAVLRPDTHSDFKKLLAPLLARNERVFIGDICHAAGTKLYKLPYIEPTKAPNTCYNHILGVCNEKRCRRSHATRSEIDKYPGFRKELCDTLKPGVTAIASRKRQWEQI